MNYFKLRTLIIVLILIMVSFFFTYVYTNGNYIRLSTQLEMRKQSQSILPMKAFNQHSHQIDTNLSSSRTENKNEFIYNKDGENENSFKKQEENPFRNIPNENDIPINKDVVNDNDKNQLKQEQFLQQQQQQILSNRPQQQQPALLPVDQQQQQQQQQADTRQNNGLKTGKIPSATRTQNVVNSQPQPIATQPCNKFWVKGKSKWFDERFSGAISSIWTRDNIRQSSDVTNWWLKLQSSKNTDVVGVMESAFRLIPDVDVYKDRSTCRRCAVVGNSGNLKGSKYGAQIDAHDMVIRINEAPLANFEEDVGYRETHRLMYPESFYSIKPDVHFVLVTFKTLDVEWLISAMTTGTIKRTWRPVKNLINVNASLVQIYNPTLMKQAHEVWNKKQGRYPSTGLLAIMFALHACDEVDVYGYGANKIGNWDHYWQNDGGRSNSAFRKTGVHNSGVETKIYEQLNSEGILKLHMGNAH